MPAPSPSCTADTTTNPSAFCSRGASRVASACAPSSVCTSFSESFSGCQVSPESASFERHGVRANTQAGSRRDACSAPPRNIRAEPRRSGLQLRFRKRTPVKLAARKMTELRALDNIWQELDQAPRGPSAAQLSQYLKQVHVTAWMSDTRQHTWTLCFSTSIWTVASSSELPRLQAPCCT